MAKISVIGLGSAGSSIAECFEQYPQYRVYKIGSDAEKDKRSYHLPQYENPEDYEENIPKLKTFFRLVQGEVLFIIGGSGLSSNASLVVLEQIKHCDISILYVKPEQELLSEKQEMMDRLVFGALQEYARSGVFKQIYLVQNDIVEEILGNVPIKEYYQKINQLISSTLHMIHVFKNSNSVIKNITTPKDISRIVTYGIVDVKTGEEKLFYPLESIREKCYYYAINDNDLENNSSIFKEIREQIKEKRTKNTKVSYGIYSTEYSENYAFLVARSSEPQKGK